MMNEQQKQQFQLLAAKFEKWLKAINYSRRTSNNYLRDLNKFFYYLEEETQMSNLSEITDLELQKYQIYLYNYRTQKQTPLSISSQYRCLQSVKKFFSFLVSHQLLAYNPASFLVMPKMQQTLPEVLSEKEVRKLIDTTTSTKFLSKGHKAMNLRDRAILELFYCAGLRRAELIELTLYDLDLDNAIVKIKGKGSESRIIPLVNSVIVAIESYLKEVRPLLIKSPSNLIFISIRRGMPLDGSVIEKILERACQRAKIKKQVTAHTLRHSFATHLLKNKADIRHIQKLLGHKCLSSTEIYTQVELSDLKDVLARHHPREKNK